MQEKTSVLNGYAGAIRKYDEIKYSLLARSREIKLLSLALIVIFLLTLLLVCLYWYKIGGPITSDKSDWSSTLSVIAPLMQVLVGIFSFGLAASASVYFAIKIDLTRRETEAQRYAIELAQRMFEVENYTKIIAPVWEVAMKWTRWQGDAGDDYRYRVVLGRQLYRFCEEPFESIDEANARPGENFLRSIDHYRAYDSSKPSAAINELSEHMVLGTWLNFWLHVHTLVSEGLMPPDLTKRLFADWYSAWLPFTQQLRLVSQAIQRNIDGVENDHKLPLAHLSSLEQLFDLPEASEETKRRSYDIASRIWDRAQQDLRPLREHLHKREIQTPSSPA